MQESLAFTFAEKAAKKNLPSAEFALGYYHEIGIGRRKDIELSKHWYSIAASHGNKDATDRLAALGSNEGNMLSRHEHEHQIDHKIIRQRTQAKVDADKRKKNPQLANSTARPARTSSAVGIPPSAPMQMPHLGTSDSSTSLRRKETMRQVEKAAKYGETSQLSQSLASSSGQAAVNQNAGSGINNAAIKKRSDSVQPRAKDICAPAGVGGVQRYSLVDTGPVAGSGGSSTVSGSSGASSASGVQIVNGSQSAVVGPQVGLKMSRSNVLCGQVLNFYLCAI